MTDTPAIPPRIFQHSLRQQWGRAILLQEFTDYRLFLFEDGKERRFKEGYYHLLETLECQAEEAFRIDKLARRNRPSTSSKKSTPKKPKITFEQQIEVFLREYPGGFQDQDFIDQERGDGNDRLKDAAVAQASELLSQDALGEMVDAGEYAQVIETAAKCMTGTKGTVQRADVNRYKEMPEDAHENHARCLYELLYGEGPISRRFDEYVMSIRVDGGASWPAATWAVAAAAAKEHIFVKPTYFKKQALVLDLPLNYDSQPNGQTYEQFLRAAKRTFERLSDAGYNPRDLLDVYVFITKTLSPKAIKSVNPPEEAE